MNTTPRTNEAKELAEQIGEEAAWKLCFQLEIENQRLRVKNQVMEDALYTCKEPLVAYVHGDEEIPPYKINRMLYVVRNAIDAAMKEASK